MRTAGRCDDAVPGACPQVPHLATGPYTATGTVEEQCGVFTLNARSFERREDGAALLQARAS